MLLGVEKERRISSSHVCNPNEVTFKQSGSACDTSICCAGEASEEERVILHIPDFAKNFIRKRAAFAKDWRSLKDSDNNESDKAKDVTNIGINYDEIHR